MKRTLSLLLSLALLLSCVSGITLFTMAEELPEPYGYFDFGGANGQTQKDLGVVRYIMANGNETNTNILQGTAIGSTGLYGITGAGEGRGLYFGGNLLDGVPENTGVVYAVEYYVNSDVALNNDVLLVTDNVNGDNRFANLKIGEKGVVFYALSAAGVDAIRGKDTRLRVKVLGEGVNKVYITGVKILNAQYATGVTAVPYSYYDFETTTACPYYPDEVITDAYQLSCVDKEITDTFAGYRYFSLESGAPAFAASATENKPVYVRFFTKEAYADTTIAINSYQTYGEMADGSGMKAHHSTLIKGSEAAVAIVKDGVGGVVISAACLRNGAGSGSFRLDMSEANKVTRVEVYDLTTYCATDDADAAVADAMHAWRVAKEWNVSFDGYQAPTKEEDGFTGTVVCNACGETIDEGEVIPSALPYAKIDYSTGTVKTQTIKDISVTNGAQAQIAKIPGTDAYGMAINTHNAGISFYVNAEQFGIEEEDLLNGTNLAITVEYYMPSAFDDNNRIAFETANSKMMAFYKNYLGTCWDAVCVNDGTPLNTNKTSIATFTVGKDITYVAAKGQFGGNDKFEEPRTVETLTMAKNLVNGEKITLRAWGGKVSAENPLYIKSITIFDASELASGSTEEPDYYYVTFEDEVTNPYYPEYATPSNNGVTTVSDTVEWYEEDTAKEYPRFNYTYVRMPGALMTTYENFKTTPVKMVIVRREDSNVDGMTFQYQRDKSNASDSARWSSAYTVNFDENGVFETVILDATFMNGLNSGASIRLRDLHYVRAGDEENGYTYEINSTDDLSGIATIMLYPLAKECAAYHDQFSEGNRNLVWVGRVEATYDEVGYSGDLVCAHCGAIFKAGEELDKLGAYAQIDFSSGTLKQTAITGLRTIGGGTSLTPEQIPGTDYYGLKLITHNDGIVLNFGDFDHFTAEDIANGREIAISVEYYLPDTVTDTTRLAFEVKGSTIMALYTNYSGRTWDAAVLNAASPMVREALNVATFTVGKNVNYLTGPGQFGAENKFSDAVSVNTNGIANAIVNGDEIMLRGWGVNGATEDDPATEVDESKGERVVYIKSITVYDAKDVNVQEADTSMEFIDYTSEFVSSPVYYPQYVQIGSAYGIAAAQVTEQGSVAAGDDVTYVYYGVTHSLMKEGQEVNPIAIRMYFKEGCERVDINFAYQTSAPWTYVTLDIVDGVAEGVFMDAAFTNGLNGKGSFRISNNSSNPIASDIERIEIYVVKDNSALLALLAQAAELMQYKTPASVAAYKAILDEAQAVADNAWATETEIAEAVAALEAAADLLVDCDHACGTETVGYVEETCFKAGYTGDLACKDCGYVAPENKGTEIPAHETTIINKKEATCKEAGNTGDLWCTVCEKIARAGNVITKLPHSWNEGEVTKEATATEYGEFTKTCTACGETLVTRLDFQAQLGDVDGSGKVDSTDARLVLQFAVKKIAPTALDLEVADVDGSGKIDSTDARIILQYAVKKIDKLPGA